MRFIIPILFCLGIFSCQKEQYRKDSSNRMTRKAKKADEYLATQAVTLTQKNIDKKSKTEKASKRKLKRQQAALNKANSNSSKVKKPKLHSGNFRLY